MPVLLRFYTKPALDCGNQGGIFFLLFQHAQQIEEVRCDGLISCNIKPAILCISGTTGQLVVLPAWCRLPTLLATSGVMPKRDPMFARVPCY